MCSAPPVCCVSQCCHPAAQMPAEKLLPAKRHYCCSANSQCELCSLYPKNQLCLNYMHNKYIVDSLSCLFRISHYQVLSTLFRLACDDIRPVWRYPRDRVWSVMENVKSPYTELLDLTIYNSLHDRCGQPINPLDRTNACKLIRLLFMYSVLVPEQRNQVLAMLYQLNSRSICPVNLDGLLIILGKLTLLQLVYEILEQDKRLRRFRVAREFWELSHMCQEVYAEENSPVVPKRRRKKLRKNMVKNTNEKKQSTRKSPPIFCTRRPVDPEETAEVAGRSDDRPSRAETIAPSRRSSAASRLSSNQKPPSTQTRWNLPATTRTNQLHPHTTPILGLRCLYLNWE